MLSSFTSIYELLGGIALAFTGYDQLVTFFTKISLDQIRFFVLIKEYIDKAIIESRLATAIVYKPINNNSTITKYLQSYIVRSKKIITLLDANHYTFDVKDDGSFEIRDERKRIFELFRNGSIYSIYFSFLFLITSGFESLKYFDNDGTFLCFWNLKDLHLSVLSNVFTILSLIFIVFPALNFIPFIKRKTIHQRKADTLYRFLILIALGMIISVFYDGFFITESVLIGFTIICCSLPVLALLYRYYYYFPFKLILLLLLINRYNSLLKKMKNRLRP